jgi:uncharacterized protein YegJ (DUF2314 family)
MLRVMWTSVTTVSFLSVLCCLAQGQDKPSATRPAEAVRPAVTILVDVSQPVSAEALRTRLRDLLEIEFAAQAPKETGGTQRWLAADKTDLIGALGGRDFRVRFAAAPVPLSKESCSHLEEDSVLRRHKAHIVVELQGAFDEDSREDDYEMLGGIASGLLRPGAVGISAREFGTFEVVDDDLREALLENTVLDVLRPVAESTLVVFLRKPRKWTEELVRAAMEKEFPGQFGEDGDGFVVVNDDLKMVGVAEHVVLLTSNPAADIDPAQFAELRVRKALQDHRAMLHIWTSGPITAVAERTRQRLLARVAAALWQDDCLALNWYCDLAMVPAHADLVQQLRSVDPVKQTLGQGVAPVVEAVDEEAMQRAIAEARKTWPKALARLKAGGEVSAKFPFATRSGGVEHIWIEVHKADGGEVQGTIGNDPVDIEGLKLGSKVTCKLKELSDWLFMQDGQMVGGFTVKVLQQQFERRKEK